MDRWDEGSDYELFMGRWSRRLAVEFVRDLAVPNGLRCLDVGCGTGALLSAVQEWLSPARLVGVDPSPEFIKIAKARLGEQVDLWVAKGEELPCRDNSFDLVVSGLVLNFITDPLAALREWKRVTRPGGSIHAYVWDYSDGMEFLRFFWDAAVALKPEARELDEGVRFPISEPERLVDLFDRTELSDVSSGSLDITTVFSDFNDYWTPFLRAQGPAPGYVSTLSDEGRTQLRDHLKATLPHSPDGSINLTARAWTIAGSV
jgi:SAM-dependent methyltransferase